LSKAINWLKSRCRGYNCENNVWDTAVVVRALSELSIKDKRVMKAAEWLYNHVMEHYKSLKPHHIAQAIIALAKYGDLQRARKLAEKLSEILRNKDIKDCYILGQVVEAFIMAGYDPFS